MSSFPSLLKSASTVFVKIPSPFVTEPAENEIREEGGTIDKYSGFDTPPPGAEFVTVIVAVSSAAMSADVMAAAISALFTNVVVRALPFQFTTDPETKFAPSAVNVKAAPPGTAAAGDVDTISGTELFTGKDRVGDTAKSSAKTKVSTETR
jgi:hypothetical protein